MHLFLISSLSCQLKPQRSWPSSVFTGRGTRWNNLFILTSISFRQTVAWQLLITVRVGQRWVMQHPITWFKGWVTCRIEALIVPTSLYPFLRCGKLECKKKNPNQNHELPGAAVWNPKLVTKHLTKPDNYYEPCLTRPPSQSARICTREAPKCPPPPSLTVYWK